MATNDVTHLHSPSPIYTHSGNRPSTPATMTTDTDEVSRPFTPTSTIADDNDDLTSTFSDAEHTPVGSPGGPRYEDLPPSYDEAISEGDLHSEARPPYEPPQAHNAEQLRVYQLAIDDTDQPRSRAADSKSELRAISDAHYNSQRSNDNSVSVTVSNRGTGETECIFLARVLAFSQALPDFDIRYAPRLGRRVALPSDPTSEGGVAFAAAYSKALHPHSLMPAEFASFVEGLNALIVAASVSGEELLDLLDSNQEYHAGGNLTSLIPTYLARSNAHYFAPRNLRIRVLPLTELLEALNIPHEMGARDAVFARILSHDEPGDLKERAKALEPWAEPLRWEGNEPNTSVQDLKQLAWRIRELESSRPNAREHTETEEQEQEQPRMPGSFPHGPRLSHAQTTSATVQAGPSAQPDFYPPRGPFAHRAQTWNDWASMQDKRWKSWGDAHEKRWKDWGERQGKDWEKWGRDFGKRSEAWGRDFGKRSEMWGRDLGKKAEEVGRRIEYGVGRGPPWARGGSFLGPYPGGERGRGGFRGGFGGRGSSIRSGSSVCTSQQQMGTISSESIDEDHQIELKDNDHNEHRRRGGRGGFRGGRGGRGDRGGRGVRIPPWAIGYDSYQETGTISSGNLDEERRRQDDDSSSESSDSSDDDFDLSYVKRISQIEAQVQQVRSKHSAELNSLQLAILRSEDPDEKIKLGQKLQKAQDRATKALEDVKRMEEKEMAKAEADRRKAELKIERKRDKQAMKREYKNQKHAFKAEKHRLKETLRNAERQRTQSMPGGFEHEHEHEHDDVEHGVHEGDEERSAELQESIAGLDGQHRSISANTWPADRKDRFEALSPSKVDEGEMLWLVVENLED